MESSYAGGFICDNKPYRESIAARSWPGGTGREWESTACKSFLNPLHPPFLGFSFNLFILQDKAGNTALMLAAREGKLDAVTLLLGLGANLEHRVVLTLHYPSPTLPRFLSIFTQYASREHYHPFVISDYPHITMQFNPSRISYHSSMTHHKLSTANLLSPITHHYSPITYRPLSISISSYHSVITH